jgi:predicted nucleotidyltransferase
VRTSGPVSVIKPSLCSIPIKRGSIDVAPAASFDCCMDSTGSLQRPEGKTLEIKRDLSSPAKSARTRQLIPVAPRVRAHLQELAKQQARFGVRLFLFGSVARTWPKAHIGADLDIGYAIDPARSDRAERVRSLQRDFEALPSVRPVDLVDMSQASADFVAEASQYIVELSDDSAAATTH